LFEPGRFALLHDGIGVPVDDLPVTIFPAINLRVMADVWNDSSENLAGASAARALVSGEIRVILASIAPFQLSFPCVCLPSRREAGASFVNMPLAEGMVNVEPPGLVTAPRLGHPAPVA
jgi:hypothetical protein